MRLRVRLRGVCVCCGACGATLPFRAWRDCAYESLGEAWDRPHPNPKGRYAPTAGRVHIHLRTTHSLLPLFHQPFSDGEAYKDPGAPLLRAVYVCSSPWQPLGSGAAKTRKTQGLPARRKTNCGECLKKILAENFST